MMDRKVWGMCRRDGNRKAVGADAKVFCDALLIGTLT
jgi:hypothetical protein